MERDENKELILKIIETFKEALKNVDDDLLNNYKDAVFFMFNRRLGEDRSIIESLVYSKSNSEIKETIRVYVRKLIENVNKDEIGIFDTFLKKNKLEHLKNTVNSQRLIQENNRMKIMFGINSRDSLTKEQREGLDDKLTIIQGMKDEFNDKLSEMTLNMIEGNKNKLGDLQSNIMAVEDMIVHSTGFKHLGLFTSDISNAISSNEMKGSKWFFNTAEIDDSKREKVLNNYKGDDLVKEYKKLMMDKLTVSYEILELAPKWYNMINGGAKTEEAIVSIRSEIGGIMEDIKEDYKLKIEKEAANKKPKTEPKPEKKDESENTSSSNSPSDDEPDGWK